MELFSQVVLLLFIIIWGNLFIEIFLGFWKDLWLNIIFISCLFLLIILVAVRFELLTFIVESSFSFSWLLLSIFFFILFLSFFINSSCFISSCAIIFFFLILFINILLSAYFFEIFSNVIGIVLWLLLITFLEYNSFFFLFLFPSFVSDFFNCFESKRKIFLFSSSYLLILFLILLSFK